MAKEKMTLRQGLDLVVLKRPIAQPNPGFILQLKLYEKELLGSVSDVPFNLAKAKAKLESSKNQTEAEEEEVNDSVPQEVQSELKEVKDGVQMMKLTGDEVGAHEVEDQLNGLA